jgi:hypothetical protein
MEKLVLLLARKPETPIADVERGVATELERIDEQGFDVSSGAFFASGLGAAHDEMMSEAPKFDAVLEITTPVTEPAALPQPTDLLPVVEGFAERCATWIDAERSAAVLGTEYVIVEGEAPIRMAFSLRGWSSLTREQFQDYWLHRHTRLGQRQLADLTGYTQVHADADLSSQAASAAGVGGAAFEGVALGCWRDEETFNAFMAEADMMNRFLEDERRFIDHNRSGMVIGRVPQVPSQHPAPVEA